MKKYMIAFLLLIPGILACPSEAVYQVELKKGLFDFLQHPIDAKLTIYEVQDMLMLYLSDHVETTDCSTEIGVASGITYESILRKTGQIPDNVIPKCSDGTIYGMCAGSKPKFCYSGLLKPMCFGPDHLAGNADDCGCPDFEICKADGSCEVQAVACYTDAECGTTTTVDLPFCNQNNVIQKYMLFKCLNPGTASAACEFTTEDHVEDVCTTCASGACI